MRLDVDLTDVLERRARVELKTGSSGAFSDNGKSIGMDDGVNRVGLPGGAVSSVDEGICRNFSVDDRCGIVGGSDVERTGFDDAGIAEAAAFENDFFVLDRAFVVERRRGIVRNNVCLPGLVCGYGDGVNTSGVERRRYGAREKQSAESAFRNLRNGGGGGKA